MAVSVTTGDPAALAKKARNMSGAFGDMLLVHFQFPGVLNIKPRAMRGWWATVEPEATEKFRAWVDDPPPPTPPDEDAETMSVFVPIPWNILTDPDYDLVSEVIPKVKEAAIMAIGHQRGDHTKCWDKNECLREQRRRR